MKSSSAEPSGSRARSSAGTGSASAAAGPEPERSRSSVERCRGSSSRRASPGGPAGELDGHLSLPPAVPDLRAGLGRERAQRPLAIHREVRMTRPSTSTLAYVVQRVSGRAGRLDSQGRLHPVVDVRHRLTRRPRSGRKRALRFRRVRSNAVASPRASALAESASTRARRGPSPSRAIGAERFSLIAIARRRALGLRRPRPWPGQPAEAGRRIAVWGWSGPSAFSSIASARSHSGRASAKRPCESSTMARLLRLIAVPGLSGPSARSRIASARSRSGNASA